MKIKTHLNRGNIKLIEILSETNEIYIKLTEMEEILNSLKYSKHKSSLKRQSNDVVQ